MNKQLLADILQAQEAESQRRMTHEPQAPNAYMQGAEEMIGNWWGGVKDRGGRIAHEAANIPESIGQLFDPEYMSTIAPPDPEQGLNLALMFMPVGPAKVATAEAMAGKGISREEIWDKLLMAKGPEGKWRTEIPDNEMRLLHGEGALTSGTGGGVSGPIPSIVSHDPLFSAMPKLKRITGQASIGREAADYGGSYYPKGIGGLKPPHVEAYGSSPEHVKSLLAHELQHGVQQEAGFATGGNPLEGITGAAEGAQQLIKRAQALMNREPNAPKLDDLMEAVTTGKIDGPTFEREYEQILKSFQHYDDIKRLNEAASAVMNSPKRNYLNQAGEAEARNVETRLDWTPEQRRATPPWKSLDVPEDELIVRLGKLLEQGGN